MHAATVHVSFAVHICDFDVARALQPSEGGSQDGWVTPGVAHVMLQLLQRDARVTAVLVACHEVLHKVHVAVQVPVAQLPREPLARFELLVTDPFVVKWALCDGPEVCVAQQSQLSAVHQAAGNHCLPDVG
jgi:hypothetical protein